MKQILLATLCALAVLTSCKKSKDNQGEAITFKRADISGAKFLTLAGGSDGKATTETQTLYKIDENGNMTAVVFYIQTGQDGNNSIENVSEDIKVTPSKVFDYGKGYMLFYKCSVESITDKYRNMFRNIRWQDFSLLVRKSDGAIFEIGEDQIGYFSYDDDNRENVDLIRARRLTYNSRGELYMVGGQYKNHNVSKLRVENEKLLLQQITTGVDAGIIVLDKNDNLFVRGGELSGLEEINTFSCSYGYIYLTNGSVAAFKGGYDDHRSILLIDNEYYMIGSSSEGKYPDYIYTYTLQKISSLAPNIAFTDVATLTTKESVSCDLAIETESSVMFQGSASCLVFDKSTQKLSIDPLPDGFGSVSFNKEGIAYGYSEQRCTQITKYNIVNMTKKTINCDRSAVPPFIQRKTKETSTDFFEFGIQNSNGAPIRVQTNLETGKVTVHEDADDRKITELIKVS